MHLAGWLVCWLAGWLSEGIGDWKTETNYLARSTLGEVGGPFWDLLGSFWVPWDLTWDILGNLGAILVLICIDLGAFG